MYNNKELARICRSYESNILTEFSLKCLKFNENLVTTRERIYSIYKDYLQVYDIPYDTMPEKEFFKIFKQVMDTMFCIDFTAYNKSYCRNAQEISQPGLYQGLDIEYGIYKFINGQGIISPKIQSEVYNFFDKVLEEYACLADEDSIKICSRNKPKGFCIASIKSINVENDRIIGIELEYSIQRSTPVNIKFNIKSSILSTIPIISNIVKYGKPIIE